MVQYFAKYVCFCVVSDVERSLDDLTVTCWILSRFRWKPLGTTMPRILSNETQHDKTNKMSVRTANSQISLGIGPVWSESSLCAQWVVYDPSVLHADNEDSDQTGRMSRLIWVFAGRTATLLVFSCRGSNVLVLLKHRRSRRQTWCIHLWNFRISKWSLLKSLSLYKEDIWDKWLKGSVL